MTADLIIDHEGDAWRVLSIGATRDGMTFAHLASTTRGRQQRNGWCPLQTCEWLPSAMLQDPRQAAITQMYRDRDEGAYGHRRMRVKEPDERR